MSARIVAWAMAAMMLAGCWENTSNSVSRENVELKMEMARLKEQLGASERLLNELKREGGAIVKYQTLTQSAKFRGGGDTLETVRDRKKLLCGGNADLPGFGYLEPDTGEFTGFDIDICRAVSAAVLGADGSNLLEIVPLTAKLRFASLQAGEVDLLSRNTTWTLSRDAEMKINFVGVSFYDGQGVMVRSEDEIRKVSELAGKAVCVQANSTSETNIRDYFASRGLNVEIRAFEERQTAITQYDERACDAYTGDKSSLVSQRSLLKQPGKHEVLIDEISREPLGLAVRDEDDNWADVVKWTLQCLISAEVHDIRQENVTAMLSSENKEVQHLLGVDGKLGRKLGLSDDFCYQAILQVGSYGDIYRRHLGPQSDFSMPRGANALYIDGGLHYPLPFN